MLDVALHTGAEHPDLVWILVPTVLSFVAGLGVGSYSATVREWLTAPDDASAD